MKNTMKNTTENLHARINAVQELTFSSDTRDILANATRDIDRFGLRDRLIIDIDSHHEEALEWSDVLDNIDDEVLRDYGKGIAASMSSLANYALTSDMPGLRLQELGGRIPHTAGRGKPVPTVPNTRAPSWRGRWTRWAMTTRFCFHRRCSLWACIRIRAPRPL
jgi:uncharacterized protein